MTTFAILAGADVAPRAAGRLPAVMVGGWFAHLPTPFPDDDDDERPIGDPDEDDEGEDDEDEDEDEDEDDEEPMQLTSPRPAGAPLRGARQIAVL